MPNLCNNLQLVYFTSRSWWNYHHLHCKKMSLPSHRSCLHMEWM